MEDSSTVELVAEIATKLEMAGIYTDDARLASEHILITCLIKDYEVDIRLKYLLNKTADEILLQGFTWKNTPEGFKYWSIVRVSMLVLWKQKDCHESDRDN